VTLQVRQREIAVRGFALGGIVVGMALEAARFRRFGAGMVAGAARRDAGQKDVGTLLACCCGGMATGAVDKAVLRVIEIGVRHIALGEIRRRDFGQRDAFVQKERVALLARLAPQELFVLGSAFRDPLRRRKQSIVRGDRLFRQVTARIARHTQVRRVRRDVGLQFGDDERVNHFRLVVGDRVRKPFVELQRMAISACLRVGCRRHVGSRRR
jgi:hypothetical protein